VKQRALFLKQLNLKAIRAGYGLIISNY